MTGLTYVPHPMPIFLSSGGGNLSGWGALLVVVVVAVLIQWTVLLCNVSFGETKTKREFILWALPGVGPAVWLWTSYRGLK